jgi:hypothetical protein
VPLQLLLPSQKVQVFEQVVSAGFAPVDFELNEWTSERDASLMVSALSHRPSEDYWFIFDRNLHGGHYSVFAPGSETHKEERNPGTWDYQLRYVGEWLGYLRRELDAPDVWSNIAAGPGLDAGTSNAAFTPTELTVIAERLAQIEARIGEVKALQQGEAQYVHETLEYLRETARTEGRRNWFNMAVGVIFSIVLFLALPPELAGALFRFAVERLQGLGLALGGGPTTAIPPPSPGPHPR